MSDFDPKTAIYTPAEVSAYATQAVENIQANQHRAIKFFIPIIDDYFAPLLPGQICSIIAQTSHYKSGFMHAWEYAIAQQLMSDGRDNEIIIHVSVEECVEEQAYLLFGVETGEDAGDIARGKVQDWNKLYQAAIKIGTIPIYRIGDSLARAEDFPNLYMSNMIRSIKYLKEELLGRQIKIAVLFFDYLQAFPFDPEVARMGNKEMQRRLQVRDDIYRLRQAAAYFDVPVVVGVQAKQVLNGAPSKSMYIPGIYDGEESSAIGQRSDRIVQLWMPKMTWAVGTDIDYKDISYVVEENILWVKVGKQRGRLPSGRTWKCRIDFSKNRILTEVMPGVSPFVED